VKKFRFIEHTADVGLVAYGMTLAEAFANAASGMFSIMAELKAVRTVDCRIIEINEDGLEALLFEWLNRLLYTFDVEMMLFRRFNITYLDNKKLRAECYGEKYDPSRHKVKLGVKSATYHMLEIDKEKNEVRVIFDV
jgi:SHS2 domain-containing protein